MAQVWRFGSCRDKDVMRLVRGLFLFAARHNINIWVRHISGHHNYLSDALSRLQVQKFRQLHPDADRSATPVSDEVWHI